jgi:menaquinone-dependent protoporphyrinogen IX oxidase
MIEYSRVLLKMLSKQAILYNLKYSCTETAYPRRRFCSTGQLGFLSRHSIDLKCRMPYAANCRRIPLISGFTKKYAQWIAEELEADLFEAREIRPQKLSEYDIIIFGGSLHAVGINGIKLIKENLPRLTDREIIVFAVGASAPKEGIVNEIRKSNFELEQKNLKLYYLRGGFDFKRLDFSNKVLMTLFRAKLSLKKNKTPDEKGMLAAYSKPIDCTRKENIKEITKYAQSL